MPSKSRRSLQDVVGKETYSVWVDMVRKPVPEGRAHRLAAVIAGLLSDALDKAKQMDAATKKTILSQYRESMQTTQ